MLKKRKKSKKHYEFDDSDKGFREKKQRRQRGDKIIVDVSKTDWRDLIEDNEEEEDQELDKDEES